jgi:PPE-repeat protein
VIPVLDFAVLPPEVNSGRMYAGAGPGPMLAAAAAWNGLAAELRATALGYSSVLSELSGHWHGPTSAAMMAAAVPYVAWLHATAGQAEHSGAQAEAAVAAYEGAFAATVPPTVVAANRARLMMLIATNVLGQNTAAIAATEAEYAEMWAQDAAAMYGYATASAAATELTAFDPPQHTTSPGGLTAQTAAVSQAAATPAGTQQATLSQLVSAMPNALQGFASPSAPSSPATGLGSVLELGGWNPFAPGSASDTTGLNGLLNAIFGTDTAFGQFANSNILNTIFGSGFYMPARFLGNATDFLAMGQHGAEAAPGMEVATAGAGQGAAAAVAGPLEGPGALSNSVSAGMGQGALVGPLSVPPSWASTAPPPGPLAPALGQAPIAAPPPQVAGTPPVPMAGNMGSHGEGRAVPQYGFRPSFVARPPAAG